MREKRKGGGEIIREMIISEINLLGSETLGTNVLELQFVLCWQTMIKP